MAGLDFIQDFAIVMIVAGFTGWFFKRLGMSAVVGFLLAGIIVGPHTPPFAFVSDQERIQTLSQLGLVFLMFSIGLGLSIRRLRAMGLGVVVATALGALLVFAAARLAGTLIGWSPAQTLFLAAMLMVSSSAIINKVLHEIGATHEPASRLAVSVTVLEDIVAVVMLTVLTSVTHMAGAGADSAPIGQTLGLILVFIIVLVVAGLLLVPRFLGHLARTADADLQTVLIVGMLLSVALLAVKAGYSLALGSFLLGAIVAETRQRRQVERYLQGLRDIFTAVFFVSIGMLMDLQLILANWPIVLLMGVFTTVVRMVATSASLVLLGHPTSEAVRAGLMLTPIGEFSFIIAQLGVSSGAAPELLYSLAVGVALFTAFTAPALIKHSAEITRVLDRIEPQFLKDLVQFYHGALERVQQRQQGNLVWQLTRGRLPQIAVGFLFVTGLLAFSKPLYGATFAWLEARFPLGDVWGIIFWVALGLLVLAPLLAVWRNLVALAAIYAEALSGGQPQEGVIRASVQAGLQTVFSIAMLIWLWLLAPIGVGAVWTVAAVVLLLGLLLVLLRRKFIWLHSRVELELGQILAEGGERQVRDKQELIAPHREWNLHLHEVVLPDHAEIAGSSLMELGLRQKFGCSIAGVERHGFPIPNPAPDLVLYPGDKLLLVATPERIGDVRRFIEKTRAADEQSYLIEEIEMEGIAVPEGSAAAGKLLVELEIPAMTGVQLVGIERDGHRLLNPGPFQGIEAGDRLLALGTHRQIERFERWLQQSAGPTEPEA